MLNTLEILSLRMIRMGCVRNDCKLVVYITINLVEDSMDVVKENYITGRRARKTIILKSRDIYYVYIRSGGIRDYLDAHR